MKGQWIGVKLDGCLAQYYGWQGIENIGKPIPKMVQRVKEAIKAGESVKIVSARLSKGKLAQEFIDVWQERNLGMKLPVVDSFDMGMKEYWADDVVRMATNTGSPVSFTGISATSMAQQAASNEQPED